MQNILNLLQVFIFLFQFPRVPFMRGNLASVFTHTCNFIRVVACLEFYFNLLPSPTPSGPSNADNPATWPPAALSNI
jgi:hypothetical protein